VIYANLMPLKSNGERGEEELKICIFSARIKGPNNIAYPFPFYYAIFKCQHLFGFL
jgi:hypothetical protein